MKSTKLFLTMSFQKGKLSLLDEEKAEWLISHDQIYKGLEWSKNEMKK
ncbi:MAG: hypothetical protein R2759_13630 [Bacteroidales bacterium]